MDNTVESKDDGLPSLSTFILAILDRLWINTGYTG